MLLRAGTGSRRSGATAVETAMIVLICLLFMFGIFEYGRFVMTRSVMQAACREAARQATTATSTTATSVFQTRAMQVLGPVKYYFSPALSIPNNNSTDSVWIYKYNPSNVNDLSQSWTAASFGNPIAVRITGNYKPMLPTLLKMPQTITLTTNAVMTCEAN